MTAIAVVVGPRGAPPGAACERVLARAALVRGYAPGESAAALWPAGCAVVGAVRPAWQAVAGLGGATLVARRAGVAVAADAALYYRGELRRLLADHGVTTTSDDPAELIAAAYLALGDRFVAALEGDFAFVLWDAGRHRLIAARDVAGRRPLYYAQLGDTLVAASSLGAVLAHPACPATLDPAALAETAAGFLGATAGSCYRAIRRLEPAHTLDYTVGGPARLARHWEPPTFERPDGLSFDDAAAALRERLERAVSERVAPTGATAVFMSGGWDSPPIFAAGRSAAQRAGRGSRLVPVSMSYPVGDPGREDETIDRIAARWAEPPRWRRIADVGLFGDVAARAARRDEPLAHVYELWNRSLLEGARQARAHVVLDGIGGDALFQLSPIFLADLLAGGRWGALAREWRGGTLAGSGARSFVRWAMLPALPAPLRAALGLLRGGRPPGGYLDRRPAPWLRAEAVPAPGLAARGRARLQRRTGESRGALESRWHLTAPWSASLLGALSAVAGEYGVEPRSPYYDRRVIALAAGRPREERRAGRETKLLLRAAMRGLIPDDVLAPRTARTGVTTGYFARCVRAELPAIVDRELRTVALADLGVVDADALRRAAAEVARYPGSPLAVPLWFTLETEWWVRAHAVPAGIFTPPG